MYQRLGGIRDPVDLSPREALSSAEALMTRQGYNVTERTETSVTAIRRKQEGLFGHSLRRVTVVAQPLPQGGVRIELTGDDREGVRSRQAEWFGWGRGLPKRKEKQQDREQRSEAPRARRPQRRVEESTSRVGKTPSPLGRGRLPRWIRAFRRRIPSRWLMAPATRRARWGRRAVRKSGVLRLPREKDGCPLRPGPRCHGWRLARGRQVRCSPVTNLGARSRNRAETQKMRLHSDCRDPDFAEVCRIG